MAKRKKQKTYAQLKKEADRVFSIWVRQRGMDENGINTCISCGVRAHWKQLQAGHFVRRNVLSLRWDKRNVWAQCPRCNVLMRGNYPAYAAALVKKLGPDILEDLQDVMVDAAVDRLKLNRSDLEALIERYTVGHSQDGCVDPGASKG